MLDYVLTELSHRKGDWPKICEATGLDYSWLSKFASGKIPSPGYQRVEQLAHYFKGIKQVA